jgi:hypothetical protein
MASFELLDATGKPVKDIISASYEAERIRLYFGRLPNGLYRLCVQLKNGERRSFYLSHH